mmetsp:Transcript_66981/g.218036  ORF Transcript_66981/g.218036 Transcript_66981/m.218036 type:complete len:258 (+) Transcript_66981:933-1706(+)
MHIETFDAGAGGARAVQARLEGAVQAEDVDFAFGVADDEVLRALLGGHGQRRYRPSADALDLQRAPEGHGDLERGGHRGAEELRVVLQAGHGLLPRGHDRARLRFDENLVDPDRAATVACGDQCVALLPGGRDGQQRHGALVPRAEGHQLLAGGRQEPHLAAGRRDHEQRLRQRNLRALLGHQGGPERQELDQTGRLRQAHHRLLREVVLGGCFRQRRRLARHGGEQRQLRAERPRLRGGQRQGPAAALGDAALQLL